MLLTNATIASFNTSAPYGLLENAAVAIEGTQITWVGNQEDMPGEYQGKPLHDLGGALITPGLIDCHTHLVFGGIRAREFELRLQGASYEEISRAGGGIVSTVSHTRAANEDELFETATTRLEAMIAEGVTTVEIKSGYGLDTDTELKMLRVARRLGETHSITVKTSFLGAHAIPAEYKNNPDEYIDQVCIPAMNAANQEGLVDAVDGFCESIAFSTEQIARVFDAAAALGLPVKLHAEQLTNLGGAALAAKYEALSADHLEYLDEIGVEAMAKAGTTAVILPGAFYTLRETQAPPIQLFRDYNVPMAIATDCNPGSSPLASPLLTMNMACTLFRMTPEEALCGVTKNAARALGLSNSGMVAAGNRADLCIWDAKHPSELAYRIGFNPIKNRIYAGTIQ